MPIVIAVRFRYNPKAFWFDTNGHTVNQGDYVLIDRDNSKEIGLAIADPFEVTDSEVLALSTPLKSIVRVVTSADYDMLDELEAKGRSALVLFRDAVKRHKLEMKPVDVDYLVGGGTAVFYFSSEERVDFRELVRDLASQLHIHVDMRQIGVRDEARSVGGLGHCGEQLCCARLGGEFFPVSIRMAKEQDLPLNPAKVSGACGRLMCCLRYEFEAYKDFKSRAPKVGAIIDTPVGQAKVISFDTPRELVNLRLTNPENSKMFTIPFSQIAIDSEKDKNDKSGACCGCSVSLDTLHECCARSLLQELSSLESSSEGLPDAERSRSESRKPRRRTGTNEAKPVAEGTNGASQKNVGTSNNNRKHRRSKGLGSASNTSGGETSNRFDAKNGQQKQSGDTTSVNRGEANSRRRSSVPNSGNDQSVTAAKGQESTKPRPGQKSSGLRKSSAGTSSVDTATRADSGYGNRRRRRTSVDASKRKGNDGTAS